MNTGTELWLFAVSLGASALGGMLGMASGIFIVLVFLISQLAPIRGSLRASMGRSRFTTGTKLLDC